ncbi:MAG TPA: hypothetical protein VFA78_06315 [Chloroflexota bacterium]|nr:hypothetical protein [Chloroflexota bacterium]
MKPQIKCLMIVTAVLLAGLIPLTRASAAPALKAARCSVSKPCTLGSGSKPVITFGITGGSLRTWRARVYPDGTVTADRIPARTTPFNDPQRTLGAFLLLAEAEGFFSLQKFVTCSGGGAGPDSSGYFISIRTSVGTKRVTDYGSCKVTNGFQELFAVLSAAAGVR